MNDMEKHIWICDNDTFKWEHEGTRYCLHIRSDEDPLNPRTEQDNTCVMACFHSRYRLGDDIEQKTPEEFWQSLVRRLVPAEKVLSALRNGRVAGIRVAKNKENRELFDVYETSYWRTVIGNSDPVEYLEYEGVPGEALYDYVEDDLTVGNCQRLLETYCEWRPLWLYEHGGLTISCGTRSGQYADPWDSGCVGWIVATKESVAAKRNWRMKASELMEAETEEYDQFLRGEVYGYTLYSEDNGEWIEEDSCWGFFGDDLLANGIPEQAGCGLLGALNAGEYECGQAVEEHTVSYKFA